MAIGDSMPEAGGNRSTIHWDMLMICVILAKFTLMYYFMRMAYSSIRCYKN